MRYQSKIDLWLVLILALISGFLSYSLYGLLLNESWGVVLLLSSAILCMVMYCIWLPFFNTHYTLTEHSLEIRSMYFVWHIRLEHIQSVQTCVSFMSSPALSIQRVEIIYVVHGLHENIYISPKDRLAFCQHLNEKIALINKPQ